MSHPRDKTAITFSTSSPPWTAAGQSKLSQRKGVELEHGLAEATCWKTTDGFVSRVMLHQTEARPICEHNCTLSNTQTLESGPPEIDPIPHM